jgi:hypothetical protein
MLFLAELYLPRGEEIGEVARRAREGAASAAEAGRSVSFVQAVFVPHDECCFVLFRSESATDVATAGVRAGLEFDRISIAEAVL